MKIAASTYSFLPLMQLGEITQFIAIEFEGMEDALEGLKIGLENLRNAIKD